MARTNRKAFTLVEMLVVIVIISMLVALLVPAVISARERARRADCMNRMSQTGKAVLQYENAKGHFPGYVNQIGTDRFGTGSLASTNNLSWPVTVLENIGRADLWKVWRKKPTLSGTETRTTSANYTVVVPEFICPSDLEKRGKAGALSFVANCGITDKGDSRSYYPSEAYDQSATGLFFDHDNTNGYPGTTKVTIALDGINDGASQTLMLSENLDATSWSSDPTNNLGIDAVEQHHVGIVWWSTTNSSAPWVTSGMVPDEVTVNAEVAGSYAPRPSSNHPGGVNAVYADGHADFISDRIEYEVFRDQMISSQSDAKEMGLIP